MSDAPKADNAEPFRKMAVKIETNKDNGFAGAFVIVPPDGSVHDILQLDSAANPAIFWSTIKTRVDIALAELSEAERKGGYGYR